VEELAAYFARTTQTIRRDINGLCDQGLARRRYGGIELPVAAKNQAYDSRRILNRKAKQIIAAEVARHVENGASLAFSIGTTPELVARALLEHRDLRILTNNFNVAMLACTNPSFEVTVAGGRLRNDDRDIIGPSAEAMFSSYKVDVGVFGVAGVDEDGTMLDFYEDEVRVRQIIQENCRLAYLVLDVSKFTRNAHVRGGLLTSVAKIFCDQEPPVAILEMINNSDAELILC
jgi:DeoR family glycerol-3-phosphate regulon repressor